MPKLVFARHSGGRIVHVDDVPSGLACGCTCLDCGEALVARKGDILAFHFGHTSGTEHAWRWEAHLLPYALRLLGETGRWVLPLNAGVIEHLGLVTRRPSDAVFKVRAIPADEGNDDAGEVRPALLLWGSPRFQCNK